MMLGLKFDQIERFDGKSNFNIWQSTVKDVLIQHGLVKAQQSKKLEKMKDEVIVKSQKQVVSTLCSSLAPKLQYSVVNEKSPPKLWDYRNS